MTNYRSDRLERAARFDINDPAARRAAQSIVWTLELHIQEHYKNGCEDCKGCDSCETNQQMASDIRAKESYQMVLRDFWEGTNWNPLPWAAEFYENHYNFARHYLGDQGGTGSRGSSGTVLAHRSAPRPISELIELAEQMTAA
jgi:hypothetical protein